MNKTLIPYALIGLLCLYALSSAKLPEDLDIKPDMDSRLPFDRTERAGCVLREPTSEQLVATLTGAAPHILWGPER